MKITWQSVNIPQNFLNLLKSISEGRVLDMLLHQIVLKNKRRVTYTYTCRHCGFSFNGNREEHSCCNNCSSAEIITSNKSLTFYKPIYPHSTTGVSVDLIFDAVKDSYEIFFKTKVPENFLDCGWTNDGLSYAKFTEGELTIAHSPRLALLKASILMPFIWESIDWKNTGCHNTEEVDHLSVIFNSLTKS